MKLYKSVFLVLVIVILSCKKDKEKKNETSSQLKSTITTKKSKQADKECKVIISGIFNHDDSFELLYTDSATEHFSYDNYLGRGFKGKEEVQELIFDLKGIYPEKIRIDVGSSKKQRQITFKEILINYDGEKLKINSTNFSDYFLPNQFIYRKGDSLEFALEAKEINGKEVYDPYFVSTPLLIKELLDL